MPRTRTPLPAHLGDVFTTRQAQAAGVSTSRLSRLPSPFHGVRCRRPPQSCAEQAAAALLAVPDGAVVGGLTAARLLGLWLPRPWTPDEPVEVVVPPDRPRPRVRGIRAWRRDVDAIDVGGLPVCSPADVVAQLACRLSVLDLVVLADSTAPWRSGRDLFGLDVALVPGRRGVVRARRALRLARAGSASPPETRLRVWFLDAGLPEPEVNGAIDLDARIVYGDLVWRDARVVVEYHGGYHFESADQRYDDFDRLGAFRRRGWTVIEAGRRNMTPSRRHDLVVEVAQALGVPVLPRRLRGRLVETARPRKRPSGRKVPLSAA